MNKGSLQISYQHLIELFDKSSIPFFFSTLGGKRLFFNEAFYQLVGYSKEELNSIDKVRFVFDEWIGPIREKRDLMFSSGKPQIVEIVYLRKDGTTVPLEVHLHTLKIEDNHGETDIYYAFVIDKSESKEMERLQKEAWEAQRVSEEKFSRAFQYLPNMVCITSPDGTYQEISDAFSEILGYSREDVIGKNAKDYGWVNLEDREFYLAGLQRDGYVRDLEFNFRRNTGEIITALISAVKIQVDDSEYLLNSLNDITKRKKAEEALQESEVLGRSILNSVPHGLFGVENRCIFFANNAMETLFGWKSEEIIGKSTRVLFRNEREWEEYGDILYSTLKAQPIVVFEPSTPFVRRDGQEILCRNSAAWVGGMETESRKIVATLEDITERKRAEEALATSEERYRVLFDQSRDAMFTMEIPSLRLTSANPAILEMFGAKTLDGFLKLNPVSISPTLQADGRPSIEASREFLEKTLREGSCFFEWTHQRLDGETFPCTVLLNRIDVSGKVLVQSTVRDISALKKAEAALRESEERYRKFINSTSDMVFLKDEDHRYIIINPGLASFFGKKEEDIIGRTDFELMPTHAARQCEYTDLQAKKLSTLVISEEVIDDRVFETHKFPIELSNGGTGIGGFIRDITERRQAEKMLQEAHEELTRSYARLREANDELEIKVAERTQELLAVNEELQAINNELIETNLTLEKQIEFRRRVEERLANTNQELADALTDLKEAQSQLVQAEKMASLGTLVAGVAHEINSPVGVGVTAVSHLGKITSEFSRLFESGRIRKKDVDVYLEDIQTAVNIVQSNLDRAAKLIRGFKQVAADQSSEEKRPFNVKEYIDAILTSLQPELKKTRHTVSVDCDELILINSYPGAFSQILTNLLMNSVTHAYDPGEAGKIAVRVLLDGQNLLLTYSDDGRGMEKEVLQKIFDPFFTTKRGAGGTGLGLYIVFNLVNQVFNGSIKCESGPGQGAIFAIQLKL